MFGSLDTNGSLDGLPRGIRYHDRSTSGRAIAYSIVQMLAKPLYQNITKGAGRLSRSDYKISRFERSFEFWQHGTPIARSIDTYRNF